MLILYHLILFNKHLTMFPKQTNLQQSSAKHRLLTQNIKLRNQISILQQKMSQVITKDISSAIAKSNKNNQKKTTHDQLAIQQNYIKKLKLKIGQLKSVSVVHGEGSGLVVKQANQLVTLKKQYENLVIEKQVRQEKIDDKKVALMDNNPIKSYKNETSEQLAKIRKDNALKQAKITELEREIRKLHKYQQLYKSYKDEKIVIENPEYQIAKLEHQKANVLKKIKIVENKWKPQIQSLDKDYFATKQICIRKQKVVEDLQKQISNWQNRISAVRNEADVLKDRERISKVPQSPHKFIVPEQKNDKKVHQVEKSPQQKVIIEKPKKKKQKVSKLIKQVNQAENQEKVIELNLIEQKIEPPKKPSRYRQVGIDVSIEREKKSPRKWDSMNLQKMQSQSQRIQINNKEALYNQTRRSAKNEFMNSKQAFSGIDAVSVPDEEGEEIRKKKILLMKNVGVGTSFYYNQNDD